MLPPMQLPMMAGQMLVGSVVAHAGAAAALAHVEQTGWMLCDGRMLETAQYPELFASLGYVYGGEGGSFAIPDYRGVATGLPSVSYLIRYSWGNPGRLGSPF